MRPATPDTNGMTLGGRAAHEKYDKPARHAQLSVILAKRFDVELSGDGVEMGEP
jgi:hypothetical protein